MITRPRIMDGAMGSELIKRGAILSNHIWSAIANTKYPDLVHTIHNDYINAGADLIIANTFRTTTRSYKKLGLTSIEAEKKAKYSLKMAVQLAHKASNGKVMVLGSIAPMEDCYKPELFPGVKIAKKEIRIIADLLIKYGVDGIILETMNNISETKTALNILKKYNIPIYVSYYVKKPFLLASGEPLSYAMELLKDYKIDTFLFNCAPFNIMNKLVDIMVDNYNGLWGIYPNLGLGAPAPNGDIKKIISDEKFLILIKNSVNKGATLIGACCGSSPRHIQLLKNTYCV